MKRFGLFVGYLAVALLIGRELHPFSLYPMYSSFPNYAYAFFLQNNKGQLMPYGPSTNGRWNAGAVAHKYYSFFEEHHYKYGFGMEDSVQLNEAGHQLLDDLSKDINFAVRPADSVKLFRRFYLMKNDSIHFIDQLMYERAVQQ